MDHINTIVLNMRIGMGTPQNINEEQEGLVWVMIYYISENFTDLSDYMSQALT